MIGRSLLSLAACLILAWLARISLPGSTGYWLTVVALGTAVWIAYRGFAQAAEEGNRVVLSLWGLKWTRDEACCHFFITGATGTGKTARAVVPIVHGLRSSMPETGILAVDSKGVLWKPLASMAKSLGQEESLRLIRVRPTHIRPEDWTPPLRLNLLGMPDVPWTTYAKLIVDTATAAGQRGGQAFFKETARDVITHAMHALEAADLPVTLANVHDMICISTELTKVLARLAERPGRAAEIELQYFKDFADQPPEQKSGTVYTVANFLRPYTPPDIADVFCSVEPNFSLTEVDAGRLICLSVPQTYQVERRYLNLLVKQLFFLHAFRRFDLEPEELRRRNMFVLALDEGQKTTLVSEDGFADHTTVDELREAGVCLISATQTPLSLYAAFETERKADVFMANLRTQIHFRAADEKGAKIISEKMGGRELRKYSGGVSAGRASRSWQMVDEPWFKTAVLQAMPEGRAIVRHPARIGKPLLKSLPFTSFTRANEYSSEPEGASGT
ncbi:MAG: type IV secretory system conjugative DNA transfer family protein [Nitrospira sp.]|nr:type IV secretory system conjugative DNA transfer family protein [Nitrospira sp.]